MLFQPWRKESELLNKYESYEQHYNHGKLTVKENESRYNHNSDIIDLAIENTEKDDEEIVHTIAPNTDHREEIHRSERKTEHQTPEMYDIGQDIGIAVNNTNTEELLKPRLLAHTSISMLVGGIVTMRHLSIYLSIYLSIRQQLS